MTLVGHPMWEYTQASTQPKGSPMTTRATVRINELWTNLRDVLDDNREFNPDGHSFRGRKVTTDRAWSDSGFMPRQPAETFASGIRSGEIDYVIYSYQTPIAYRFNGVWIVLPFKYSVTTTRHQGKVRVAVSQLRSTV